MNRIEIGKKGEETACKFLISQGVSIIARNIRTPYGEIDILGKENDCLLFTEVKTRKSKTFGFPEEAVHAKKQEHMINSALSYLQENYPPDVEWRIDVIAINIPNKDIDPEIRWFKNAIVS